jgi:hypothetical protein
MSLDSLDQRRRALANKLVEAFVTDPSFRTDLTNDSKGALQARGIWDEYTSLVTDFSEAETSGYLQPTDSNCCGSY